MNKQGHSLDSFNRVKKLFPCFVGNVLKNIQKNRNSYQREYNDEADIYVFLMNNIKEVELYYADLKTEIDTYIEGCKLESLRVTIQNASRIIETKKHFKIVGIKSPIFLHYLSENKTKIDQFDELLKDLVSEAIDAENEECLDYLLSLN